MTPLYASVAAEPFAFALVREKRIERLTREALRRLLKDIRLVSTVHSSSIDWKT